jgi:SAM-dependent methyltransferase
MVLLVSGYPTPMETIADVETADGWVLAAKYPDSVVYTLMTNQDGHRDRGHSWPAPENHQVVFLPASDDFFPFPDNYFDAITSRTFSSAVRFKSWLPVFQECHRALKPQGWLEIHSLDAAPTRRGDLLNAWLDARLLCGIDESGLVAKPSERVLDYLEIAGFGELKKCKIALPVNVKSGGSGQELQDASKVMMYAGRHYYQELYSRFLRGRAPWWWGNRSIREECDKMGTMLGFIISFGQKEF